MRADICRGTTCKVGILQSPVSDHNVIASQIVHTRDPESTIAEICEWLNQQEFEYTSMGVAAFGPLCLDKASEQYGCVTTTPKEGW